MQCMEQHLCLLPDLPLADSIFDVFGLMEVYSCHRVRIE